MRALIIFALLAMANFLVSIFIHIRSVTSQVNPYLSEEQRVAVGNMMLDITVPTFALSSIIFSIAAYAIAKKLKGGDH